MYLSDISIKRPVMTTVIILIIAILGLVGMTQLGVELFPEIEFPVIVVTTTYQGAGPEEVERLITKTIEDNVTLIDNVKYIESTSAEGASTVMIRFNMGTDLDVAANDVRDQVSRIRDELPEDSDEPIIMKVDPSAFPIMRLAVSGKYPLKDIYELADNQIKTEIGKIAGVGLIRITGGEEREIVVAVDRDRLSSTHLTVSQVITALAQGNVELPGGHITRDSREITIRVPGEIEDIAEITGMPIPGTAGKIVVGDVAEVHDTVAEIRSKTRFNTNPSVGIEILKQGDANAVAVGDGVKAAVEKLNTGRLPSTVEISVVTDDTTFIRGVIEEVRKNMIEGIILTAIALFLFLHNWRGTIVVALAMPVCVVATFVLVRFADYTINMMTMMGLAISIGILVNNAILVLENIYRYINMGEEPKIAAQKATSEIAVAVASTTLTNIVVFLPIAFMESIVGQIFRQFAMTVVFATVFSLFISFTLTPMAASLLLRSKKKEESSTPERLRAIYRKWDHIYDSMANGYGRIVQSTLRHPWKTVIICAVIFMVVMKTIPQLIGGQFFPRVDQGEFLINIETDVSSSMEYTDRITRKIEDMCMQLPEVRKVYSTVGSMSGDKLHGSQSSVNLAQVVVQLTDAEERRKSTDEITDELRYKLADTVGAKFSISPYQQGGPGGKPIEVEIRGNNFDVLNSITKDVTVLAEGGSMNGKSYDEIRGLVDMDTDWREGKAEIRLVPDRDRLRRNNVSARSLAETVRAYYTGVVSTKFRDGDDEYDIRVKLNEAERHNPATIPELLVMSDSGMPVRLGEIANTVRSSGPVAISRKDREHMVKFIGETSGTTPGEVFKVLDQRLRNLDFPEGYSYTWAGDIEMMQENFGDLYQAMFLAVILTYLMLAGILESWTLAFLIMLSLPLSFVGVFLGLLIRGLTLNIFSLMGMVMLIGLVINNAIVIMDYIGVVRAEGKKLMDAIPRACAVRLRPILMANLTTVIAMIPLALGHGEGGEYRAPMAVTQMGGMIAGGLLALIVAPVLYYLAHRKEE